MSNYDIKLLQKINAMNPIEKAIQTMSPIEKEIQAMNAIKKIIDPYGEIKKVLDPCSEIKKVLDPCSEIKKALDPCSEIKKALDPWGETMKIVDSCNGILSDGATQATEGPNFKLFKTMHKYYLNSPRCLAACRTNDGRVISVWEQTTCDDGDTCGDDD